MAGRDEWEDLRGRQRPHGIRGAAIYYLAPTARQDAVRAADSAATHRQIWANPASPQAET